ncbi:hypothetical protein E4U53_004476 [Claviceps sorghi]|nr:hypothetical protein E4U53_004476 [Claviceps sorghi]
MTLGATDDETADDTDWKMLAEDDASSEEVSDVETGLYEESVELKPEANKVGPDDAWADDEATADTRLELAAVSDEAETDTESTRLVTDVATTDPETSSWIADISVNDSDAVDAGPDGDCAVDDD